MTLIIESLKELDDFCKEQKRLKKSIALVPTMGNLHNGHLSLFKKARASADIVLGSIFVNPTQFAANEDLSKYPRTFKEDLEKIKALDIDAVFYPKESHIYRFGIDEAPRINFPTLMPILCGKIRPTHFQGVASIVTKLFLLTKADIAVFGKKDFQQLTIIKRLVDEFYLNIKIIDVETEREKDGLALSSRNQYIKQEDREKASILYKTLVRTKNIIKNKTNSRKKEVIAPYLKEAIDSLNNFGVKIDYFECRDKNTLSEDNIEKAVLFGAIFLSETRILDNIEID